MKSLKLILLFVACVCQRASGYEIKGRIANYSSKWRPQIYLAIITSVNQFNITSPKMLINSAALDKDGNFDIQGNNLPDAYTFYRLYLSDSESTSAYYAIKNNQNFIHLPLNNQSAVNINADLALKPIYDADIEGVQDAGAYKNFYDHIFYLSSHNKPDYASREKLDDNKQTQLIFESVARFKSNLYTIFALAHLDWDNAFGANSGKIRSIVAGIDPKAVNPVYLAQLNERLEIYSSKRSYVYNFVNYKTFYALSAIIMLMFAVTAMLCYYIFLLRKKLYKKNRPLDANMVTPKEKEIIALIKQGLSNKQISSKLFIEVSTVKSHIGNIYQKLEIRTRKQLDEIEFE